MYIAHKSNPVAEVTAVVLAEILRPKYFLDETIVGSREEAMREVNPYLAYFADGSVDNEKLAGS